MKKSVSWKNKKSNNVKSSFLTKLKKLFSKQNNTLKEVKVFPNTFENVEARKSVKINNKSNNNNNNNTRKKFFNTPKNLRQQHYRNRIAKTLYRGKYFIE
jgi:hypothetical protein